MGELRPSPYFRLMQVLYLPWRLVCLVRGHFYHKWACHRCLKVDEVRLATFHVGHLLTKGKFPKRHDL